MIAVDFWIDRDSEPVGKYSPGDVIPDDHPKRVWLLKSGIAVVDVVHPEPEKVAVKEVIKEPAEVKKPAVKNTAVKPKPTDSVDAHREFLKGQGIETKGLTRAQMVKIIAGIEE